MHIAFNKSLRSLLSVTLVAANVASGPALDTTGSDCGELAVMPRIDASGDQLSLADVLVAGSCPPLERSASQVSLGAVPQGRLERLLDGQQIRGMLLDLVRGNRTFRWPLRIEVPARIAVQHAGAKKSCQDVIRLVAQGSGRWQKDDDRDRDDMDMDCAALPAIPQDTPLEVARVAWDAGLRRWEFALRCTRPQDCVPFLLWARPVGMASARSALSPGGPGRSLQPGGGARNEALASPPLIKRGQTAMLTWDNAGIRIVVPVVCLDAGRLGDIVRVRFRDGQRVLRAEVMSRGRVTAGL
jgi:hypothetical protein